MESVVMFLITIVVVTIVYISADKWHRIADKYKKMVGR